VYTFVERETLEVSGSTGSVLAYNAPFEKARLKECCDFLPEKSWYGQIEKRIVHLESGFTRTRSDESIDGNPGRLAIRSRGQIPDLNSPATGLSHEDGSYF
jgi:hypothetical protein